MNNEIDNCSGKKYLKTTDAAKYFGRATIRKWEKKGILDIVRTNNSLLNSHRRYDINSYNPYKNISTCVNTEKISSNKGICYCRVSSKHQQDDLDRQIKFMQEQCPNYEIIKDIGSGINFKRPGLLKLIKKSIDRDISLGCP